MRDRDLPLRVLLLDHTGSLGGGELALARLCRAIDPLDAQLRVVLFEDGPFADLLRSDGVQVDVVLLDARVGTASRDRLGSLAALRSGLAIVPFVFRLARFVRSVRPDVVHTSTLKADVLGSAAALLARVPVVWYVHDRIADDYLPAPVARVFRVLTLWPRAVIANSRASAEMLGHDDVVVAYPGFTPDQVRVDAVERTEPPSPVVGLVGRLSPTKGQLELVDAAREVLRVHPAARFRIVGSPMFGAAQYARDVTARIEELGLTDAVSVEGFSRDVAAVLDSLTVLVHASPVPEPFGQVVVEAMIRGVPVVATDAGGVPEILEDDGASLGVLVAPGDVTALARGIIGVLDDPAAAHERAAEAYRSALRRFPVDVTARAVLDVWHRIAARRG